MDLGEISLTGQSAVIKPVMLGNHWQVMNGASYPK